MGVVYYRHTNKVYVVLRSISLDKEHVTQKTVLSMYEE